jgi:hypothetical protein
VSGAGSMNFSEMLETCFGAPAGIAPVGIAL